MYRTVHEARPYRTPGPKRSDRAKDFGELSRAFHLGRNKSAGNKNSNTNNNRRFLSR